MIYLQSEIEQFEKTKESFEAAYIATLERMLKTYHEKGETRDIGSPIHHRMSPVEMLGLIKAKSRRLDSIMSMEDWQHADYALAKIIEESHDIANFAAYIAALCLMLTKELEEGFK